MNKPSWQSYYMNIAQAVSKRSNCIKRQIGAVIVIHNRVVSTGYNGTPRGVPDCADGGCARCANSLVVSGTSLDTCWCCHAEENAIVQSAWHGVSTAGGTLYTMFSPCVQCAKMIINAGIVEVVYQGDYPQSSSELLKAGKIVLSKLLDGGNVLLQG